MINKYAVKIFCCEDISLIENYEKAISSPETWDCHHKMETHRRNGKPRVTRLSKQDLIDWNIYYNRPADELVFLPKSEHRSLHKKGSSCHKGKHHSEETKHKMSEAMKGKNNPMFGNASPNKGMHWYNDGVKNIRNFSCPDGFVPGRLK